ncbi:hypothetical protein GHT06_022251 [Daphnia sinensis]|uniref:Uncharacterized protein n=1 Tax=Daphnia sinensis TaxID=1820382 RepID=A0AAD5KGZ8_9CRUS|nr:hypothetical protein GHT06_022251 [Daphnia sinensis]
MFIIQVVGVVLVETTEVCIPRITTDGTESHLACSGLVESKETFRTCDAFTSWLDEPAIREEIDMTDWNR